MALHCLEAACKLYERIRSAHDDASNAEVDDEDSKDEVVCIEGQ